jgi:hydrogenase expression/formation protein HypC
MCLAVPGEVMSIRQDATLGPVAAVRYGGLIRDTYLALVPEVEVGDFVIAHVGFAISVLDRRAAEEALALWDRAAELEKGLP